MAAITKLKLFLALSRTPHGLLDVTTPLLVVFLWLGKIPEKSFIFLGMLAAIGGYTAVYALNDIVDYQVDKEKLSHMDSGQDDSYLDSVFVRHPLAQGLLSMPEAIVWATGWGTVSLVSAYLLNPICAVILIVGCILEAIYCKLLRISQLRALVSGVVKTLGGIAAVFAVDPRPDPLRLLFLFLWLFFWEIGGQNVPADWHDIEQDTASKAKTIPVVYGPNGASIVVLSTLLISMLLSTLVFWKSPLQLSFFFLAAAFVMSFILLLFPALKLYRTKKRNEASGLFNKSSYYPFCLMIIALISLVT